MKKSDSNAFVTQMLIYTIVTLCTSGSVGLGVVWFRHQISITAASVQQTELRIREVERRIYEASAAIETEQGPEALKRSNQTMRLGLVPLQESQVNRVTERLEMRLAAKQNSKAQGHIQDGPLKDGPVLVRFNLDSNR